MSAYGEYDASGNLKKAYGWIPDSIWGTNPVFMLENGNYYFYQNDHLGTPQKIIDTSGRVVWSATYDSFGNIQIEIAEIENNLRFPGQYYDSETGLHQNWWRDYKPEIGRYISEDPIGLEGGINLYTYVGNSPMNENDPLGLMSISDIVGGAIEGFKHRWESGYYECYARCVAGPFGLFIGGHLAVELGGEKTGELAAKSYYHFTDKRFKAWGKHSKVLVPQLAKRTAKYLRGGAALWLAYDAWHCISKCTKCLK